MKKRMGFVSNSSSASFIVDKEYLTQYQINGIKNREQDSWDFWNIIENEDTIEGNTAIDNINMYEYLTETLNINKEYIDYEGD